MGKYVKLEALQREPIRAEGMSELAVAFASGYNTCMEQVRAIQAVDAAEVVRCRDCAFWRRIRPNDGRGAEPCRRTCGYFNWSMEGEEFCSLGQRREEEK